MSSPLSPELQAEVDSAVEWQRALSVLVREGMREAMREQALSAAHGPLLGPGRRELARILEPVTDAVCSWGEFGDVTLYRSRHHDGRVTWMLRVYDGESADWERP